jgi:HSP20 family molecular chaperone IbpA
MSLIQHGYFPRSKFDLENWLGENHVGGGRDYFSTLDIFDAFDDFDHMLGRNMEWLQRPSFIEPLPMLPRIPDKYRVTVDVTGYTPKSIKTEFKDGNLIVSANEEHKSDKTGDYMVQQFKKTFKLPKNAETDKMASFVAGGQLVVEVPLRVARTGTTGEDLFPYTVDNKDGTKTVKMTCTVPQGIEPNKINVTCKDRDLIIRAEDKMEKPDYKSKIMYYKRCTFPELTDFTEMKCMLDNGKLLVEAPINPTLQYTRRIPIEQKATTGTPRPISTQGV